MRCPKCSFISFDFLENCVKCGKNISAAAEELHGTVASMAAPVFLKFEYEESGADEAFESSELETEEAFDLGDGEEEVAVDLSSEEETAEMEITGEEAGFEVEADDAAMDIADLAPAEEETDLAVEAVSEEFDFATEETVAADEEQAGTGLADLQVDGIDLEAAPAPAGDKGKVMPSVKTGTALDDFDIDLGDLLPK